MNPFKTIYFTTNKKKQNLVIRGKYTLTKDGEINQNGTSRWKCTNGDICSATVTLTKDE